MTWEVRTGHVLDLLRAMPSDFIHCVVTSPPYWGLRAYKTESQTWSDGWRGELGLEPTPELYVYHLVEVFRAVRRVLRHDGSCWINLGDSYWGGKGRSGSGNPDEQAERAKQGLSINQPHHQIAGDGLTRPQDGTHPILKPKDLCGMPWRVAFALQADGWWLRSDIIWAKPNPMPESVTDRPTKAHEYLFLMAKSDKYYYDAEAIKERAIYFDDDRKGRAHEDHKSMPTGERNGIRPVYKDARSYDGKHTDKQRGHSRRHAGFNNRWDAMSKAEQCSAMRNKRSVWTIPTQPFPEAHFATYPEKLVQPCIKAGTSERGCCDRCGAGWEREVKDTAEYAAFKKAETERKGKGSIRSFDKETFGLTNGTANKSVSAQSETVGWHPTCACQAETQPALVLDPFCGSGTTGVVALKLGRAFLGMELQPAYVEMAKKRIGAVMPLFA